MTSETNSSHSISTAQARNRCVTEWIVEWRHSMIMWRNDYLSCFYKGKEEGKVEGKCSCCCEAIEQTAWRWTILCRTEGEAFITKRIVHNLSTLLVWSTLLWTVYAQMTYADIHAFCIIETFVTAGLGNLFLDDPKLAALFEAVGKNATLQKHIKDRKPTPIWNMHDSTEMMEEKWTV